MPKNRREETMSGEEVVIEEQSEVEGPPEPSAPVVRDDVLNPELVEMYHPDLPSGPSGEPQYSTTSRGAFEQIWQDKGWALRPDPYAPTEDHPEMAEGSGPEAHGVTEPEPAPEQ
jgi:hypothetical protein